MIRFQTIANHWYRETEGHSGHYFQCFQVSLLTFCHIEAKINVPNACFSFVFVTFAFLLSVSVSEFVTLNFGKLFRIIFLIKLRSIIVCGGMVKMRYLFFVPMMYSLFLHFILQFNLKLAGIQSNKKRKESNIIFLRILLILVC